MFPSVPQFARAISIAGYRSCGFARRAVARAQRVQEAGLVEHVDDSALFRERDEYQAWLSTERNARFSENKVALSHTSSPLVWADDDDFIGGCDAFMTWADAEDAEVMGSSTPAGEATHPTGPTTYAPLYAPDLSSNGLAADFNGSLDRGDASFLNDLKSNDLSPTQFMVLRHGATDDRGATEDKGGFDDTFVPDAEYLCAACSSPLYTSAMKFDCGCGWPGFFRCVEGAVFAKPDADGVRHEIVCNGCDSHLGHVFFNEGFDGMECAASGNTVDTDHRHCVNSSSLTLRHPDGRLRASGYRGAVFQSAIRHVADPDAPSTMTGEWLEGRDEVPPLR